MPIFSFKIKGEEDNGKVSNGNLTNTSALSTAEELTVKHSLSQYIVEMSIQCQ